MSSPDTAAIQKLVTELLSALGVEGKVEVAGESRIVARITSPESEALTGPRGEHLQALNTIARRLYETARGGEESGSFLIDVNNFHERRLNTLRESATLLAQRARLFKHEVELPPMSSYERLVVHEMFADDPELSTESEGQGKARHVVLKYRQ